MASTATTPTEDKQSVRSDEMRPSSAVQVFPGTADPQQATAASAFAASDFTPSAIPRPNPPTRPAAHIRNWPARTFQRLRVAAQLQPRPRYKPSAASARHAPPPDGVVSTMLEMWDRYDWRESAFLFANRLNTVWWKKTGYGVSEETACFVLRMHGRSARMGVRLELRTVYPPVRAS